MTTPRHSQGGMALFARYPTLEAAFPRARLSQRWPTPLARLEDLERAVGSEAQIYIKRDDLTSDLYGGNKARKLELTFGHLLQDPPDEIVTGGGVGSHMCVAVAAVAREYGIPVRTLLFEHARSPHVRDNLRLQEHFGAQAVVVGGQLAFAAALAWEKVKQLFINLLGGRRVVIWPGDSNAWSCVAYVSAAFELEAQLNRDVIPAPDAIYVPVGSGGTMAGLLVGMRLAGLDIPIVGVRVAPRLVCHAAAIATLANATLDLLRAHVSELKHVSRFRRADISLEHGFYGDGYATATEQGNAATELVQRHANIQLDDAYTAKAMAALLQRARTEPTASGRPRRLLFWHTLSAKPLPSLVDTP